MTNNFDENNDQDDDDFDLEEDYPTLLQVSRFASLLKTTKWFSHIGEDLNSQLVKNSRQYLEALGFPDSYPAQVDDWADAIHCLETNDWNSPAWEAEEQLTASLITEALEFIEEDVLEVALTNITSKASTHITAAIEQASIRWAFNDDEILRAAMGQAVQACYQAALVIAVGGEEDHPFALKFSLYEKGHWPLGIAGNTLNIF